MYTLEPPRRGGSNAYPQSMFWAEARTLSSHSLCHKLLGRSKKKKKNNNNNVDPCKHQFYYIKLGFKGVKIIQACFLWCTYSIPPFCKETTLADGRRIPDQIMRMHGLIYVFSVSALKTRVCVMCTWFITIHRNNNHFLRKMLKQDLETSGSWLNENAEVTKCHIPLATPPSFSSDALT